MRGKDRVRGITLQTLGCPLPAIHLAIQNAGVHWRRPIEWTAAMSQFDILFGDRFAVSAP